MTAFDELTLDEIEWMIDAGNEIEECYRVLRRVDANIVGEVLKGHGTFYEWDHYPPGDVFDYDTGSQYYYHSHRPEGGEHGHFHTFLRDKALPDNLEPVPHIVDEEEDWPSGEDRISHLVAVACEKRGYPTHLFTTNRWVTGETMHSAEDMIAQIDHFDIDHAYPSWPVNRWLTAMVRFFRPQIEILLRQRDEKLTEWATAHPGEDIHEDRDLELTSRIPINVGRQMKLLQKAKRARK